MFHKQQVTGAGTAGFPGGKCAVMSALVKDVELKDLMRQEFELAQIHIDELSRLLKSSVLNEPGTTPEGSPDKAVLH